MDHYNHLDIEKKWQNFWDKNKTFKAFNDLEKPKYYALDMFPYPSGAGLHVGHPLGYTATDIISRKKRMEGYNVLHPMGWDAFGLPAENYAIKTGVHPEKSTNENIKNFTRQIKSLGFSYDWDREVNSTDPEYYKWSQWLFLQFYKKGLLYEDAKPMNWCPSCKVVCANEEVESGLHERCGNKVERKPLRQWMFRITDYAERLLKDLEKPKVFLLHGWEGTPDNIWFPSLRKKLEKWGFEVIIPKFPNSDFPKYSEWKSYFIDNYASQLDENSIILGHSLGAGFIQRFFTEEDVKVDKIILTAPTPDSCGVDEIKDFFEADFDYGKIKNASHSVTILGSENDNYISQDKFKTLTKQLDGKFILCEGLGHFGMDEFKILEDVFEKESKNILDWPEKIKAMQRNWIGKSTGADVDFEIAGETVTVYTTRPDTLFGATYMVLSPEHPLVDQITTDDQAAAVNKYQKVVSGKSELERTELNKEKTGVFTGGFAVNPVNDKEIPVWIADYVLMSYGTGAIMAVPAHDERDFEFAKKYDISIVEVVGNLENSTDKEGGILKNSEFLDGLPVEKAIPEMIKWLEEKKLGRQKINYRLRDWIFTRQRYWGEPIPLVHCDKCGIVPVPESELPLELPETAEYKPSATGESPLAKIEDWVSTTCPTCNGAAKRETSTMPNWAGSSWYWLRYMDANNSEEFCSQESEAYWGPVDLYVGGAEHAVLHLLYARFWHKALYDMNLVSTKEPFKKLVNQGMIVSFAYENKNGGLVPVDEVEERDNKFIIIKTGEEVKKITAKMSKSLKNVINPDAIVEQYGADTLRMYEMFMGPFDQSKVWDKGAVSGIRKFLDKVHRYFMGNDVSEECPTDKELIRLTHQMVKIVGDHIDDFKFNTAISQMMVWMNTFAKLDHVPKIAGGRFIRCLAPFAPHLAEEIWTTKFKTDAKTITFEKWPSYKEEYLVSDTVTYAIQVNGKLRANIEVEKSADKEAVLIEAKALPNVSKWLDEGSIIKEIFVPGKIVGFVVKPS